MTSFRAFITLLGIGFLLCSCGTSKSSGNSEGSKLRVMAYNIHHAQPMGEEYINLDGIARVIELSGADLIALQEVDVDTERSGKGNQAEMLAQKLGLNYFFAKSIDYGGGDYGVAILSRFPILEQQVIPLPGVNQGAEQRVLGMVRVKLPTGKEVAFASTHLDHKGDPSDRLSQLKEVIRVTKEIDGPVILAGDFNALPDSATMEMVYDNFSPTCEDCGHTYPANNPNKTIDYIVYKDPSNSLRVLENTVIEEPKASDHRPIRVLFSIE